MIVLARIHVIAYRMRKFAGFDRIPKGVGPNGTDNIDYLAAGEAPNGFKHPHCFPTDIPSDKVAHRHEAERAAVGGGGCSRTLGDSER